MSSLQEMFPSLTLFSDLNWDQVTEEYNRDYSDLSFPEYLQQKAMDGDCPPYLFELAFYELALHEIDGPENEFPDSSGIYLNPSALFLALDFDVKKMIEDSQKGKVDVIERPHVLCLYLGKSGTLETLELNEDELDVLQLLEDGPQSPDVIAPKNKASFEKLHKLGLVLSA